MLRGVSNKNVFLDLNINIYLTISNSHTVPSLHTGTEKNVQVTVFLLLVTNKMVEKQIGEYVTAHSLTNLHILAMNKIVEKQCGQSVTAHLFTNLH